MAGGQHRIDDVTRTELVGWIGRTTRELQRIARQRKQRDCTTVGVCAKEIKKELNALDETDFVRDVDNRDYHRSLVYLLVKQVRGA
jgi:hypothetical protein